MRIAIMESSFPGSDRATAAELTAQAGAQGLELIFPDRRAVDALSDDSRRAGITQSVADAGVVVSCLALTAICRTDGLVRPTENTAAAMDLIREALLAAADMGVSAVLVPFFGQSAIELEDDFKVACDCLLELSEAAEDAGVMIGVESNLAVNQQHVMLGHTGGGASVRHYFDTGNVLLRKRDPATEIRDLGTDALVGVHFKDAIVRSGQQAATDVLMGDGQVNFQAAAQSLKAVGYDGWVTLETPGLDDPAGCKERRLHAKGAGAVREG
jgi:sugar phosphate isomerase/epimerase